MTNKLIDTALLIEDNPGDARLLREMFNEQGSRNTELTIVRSMAEAEQYLSGHAVDIILLDLGLPDAQGMAAVRRAHAAAPRTPLVVLTGLDDKSLPRKRSRKVLKTISSKAKSIPTAPPAGCCDRCAMRWDAKPWKTRCLWKKSAPK